MSPGRTHIARLLMCLLFLNDWALAAQSSVSAAMPADSKAAKKPAAIDRSGRSRKGNASYYGREFYRKKMANGKRMNPHSNVAASKTLPLGTKAKVTNLETGKSEVVNIGDRGPYVKGRIIDVSPATAEKLDLKKDGTAPVEVKPLELPPKAEAAAPGVENLPK